MSERIDEAYELKRLATELAHKYLKDHRTRYEFLYNIDSFINSVYTSTAFEEIDDDVARVVMNQELDFLKRQRQLLILNDVVQYSILVQVDKMAQLAQYQKNKENLKLLLAGTGLVGGSGQVIAGVGLSATPFGAPLIAHGINNIVENGYYVIYRKDIVGPIRHTYRFVAHSLGIKNSDQVGDYAYATIDVALSVNGLTRYVLKPEAWRLFNYINTDYIRAWKRTGVTSFMLEFTNDASTIINTYNNYN